MSELSKENKLKILARNFYADNRDQYDDYRHAVTEFMANIPPDTFIDFALKSYLEPEKDRVILMNDEGHVIAVRESDGHLDPRTEWTQDEGEEFESKWHEALDEYPDLDGLDVLEKMGWRRI